MLRVYVSVEKRAPSGVARIVTLKGPVGLRVGLLWKEAIKC